MAADLIADYSSDYSSSYYSGGAVADSALVPGQFAVAINGHPYLLNTDPNAIEVYGNTFKEESLPLLRSQADQGKQAGEQSLSPSQFWRRSQETWHGGAGQTAYDREESSPTRFRASKGVDPWTKYQLSLLNSTTNIRASANTDLRGVTCNGRFYVADGTTLTSTADLSTFTTVTGVPAAQATSLASTGALLYAAYGTSGIYSISTSTGSSYVTGTVSVVGFAKGRLLAANGATLHNPVAAGALPTPAFYTQPDTGWTWTAFAEGNAFIYAAGGAGDISRIYRIAVQPDGTGLTVPVVAASLPTGERVRSMHGYLGFVIIGTDKGVRFATAATTGDLTLGALIPTPGPVHCIDAADRFVWFGWTNYDADSSGLGRFDLQTINDGLAPAYASDLMATAQGTVRAVGQLGTRKLFTVDGVGTFAEGTTPVASGSLVTGQINYGIADPKVPVAIDLKHAPLTAGTLVSVSASFDRATATVIGSSSALGSVSPTPALALSSQGRVEEFELTFGLTSAAGSGPVLNRWTLLAYPAPEGASIYSLPLVLAPRVTTLRETEYTMDPFAEYSFLTGLHDTREVITVQVGEATFSGTLEEFTWVPERHTFSNRWWAGTFIVKVRRVR